MPGSSSVAAQISPSERSTSLPTETRPAKAMPRALPRDMSVPMRLPLCEAAKMRPAGRSGSSKAAFAVSMVRVRRSTTPRLDGPTMRRPVRAQVSRRTFGARFRETVGQYGCDLDAETAALLDRRNGSFRRRHDVGVLGRLGQCGERRPGALAEHGFAPRIDRIDAARIAHPPQKFQRPPGGFGRIVRLSDDGDGAGREEELAQIAFRRARHELEQSK